MATGQWPHGLLRDGLKHHLWGPLLLLRPTHMKPVRGCSVAARYKALSPTPDKERPGCHEVLVIQEQWRPTLVRHSVSLLLPLIAKTQLSCTPCLMHPTFLSNKSLISISRPSFGKIQLPHTILASLLMSRSLVPSSNPINIG